jgi:enediyne polyketide synthase
LNTERIAIVGIGLRYPDAASTDDLWENILAGRRAFRRLPDQRMNGADYYSPDPDAPDRFYSSKAAVLRDFEFDRIKHKVAGSTFRSTDLTHWLALDVAATALADAGFPEGEGLPRKATGVVVGNSLTGEFSRANLMRLRWPYVRRTLAAALTAKGWDEDETSQFLRDLEPVYKAPFPAIDEDTLAGGLANTIAGRICNHFDLGGGGFTVDGACSSSLLAVATGAKALVDHDLDVVLAGGVDLSIDPFEVIGFAKTGALASGEMKIYDKDSNGFWPGEGSGVLVLMREEDAIARGLRIYASITGWGISSDGKGGITRPEADGHILALTRAYERAGYGVETVSYFEGHGTGTAVGDATEITALSNARREADPLAAPAALSSVKGNFGHTKAAAGVAGLIKATLSVYNQVIPPGTGHYDPHEKLTGDSAALYVPKVAELWPSDQPIRAGVSAMGFGGINTHIAIEGSKGATRRTQVPRKASAIVGSRQDTELLLLDGNTETALRARIEQVLEVVPKLSFAELGDLAGQLAKEQSGGRARAAVVTTSPDDATAKLERVLAALDAGEETLFTADGVYLARRQAPPKIAYLFPGQGSGRGGAGALRRRFPAADAVFAEAAVPVTGDQSATEVAQPRIVAGSVAALRVLHTLGIDADVAVGHSLGELSALAWAGAMDGKEVLNLAKARGEVMANASRGGGAMAGITATPEQVEALFAGDPVVIAGYNGPKQTVVAGDGDAVDRVCERAKAAGLNATRINVSHAFHSPAVEPAAEALTERLAEFAIERPVRPIVSTVTGDYLDPTTDLRALLRAQVVLPVRFHEAVAKAVEGADLAVEVGPGRVLTGLVKDIAPGTRVLAIDTDSQSLSSLLSVVGAAYALGADLDAAELFTDRVLRPLPVDGEFNFLSSPCEAAPDLSVGLTLPGQEVPIEVTGGATDAVEAGEDGPSTLDLLRTLAAERVELPLETVTAATHPLDDLHLSSITVGQLVNDVTRQLGLPTLEMTTNFATVTLGELADLIDEAAANADGSGGGLGGKTEVDGVAPWVRPFSVDYLPVPAPFVNVGSGEVGEWQVFAPAGHPLAERLRIALAEAGIGDGVLLCLPDNGEDHVGLFLEAGKAAIAQEEGSRFVVVQGKFGASGLTRTAFLESNYTVPTTLITLADLAPSSAAGVDETLKRVITEAAATTSFAEVRYEADGTRTQPLLRVVQAPVEPSTDTPLDASDVLLVSGGGKGITAECALVMAKDSGAKLALIGRDEVEADEELVENMARFAAAGITYQYERADVTDAEQIARAVAAFEAGLGPVTAVMHGAGRNVPGALANLSEEEFHKTLAPKVAGLRTIMDAVGEDNIKLLVTFGSIIGRAGLKGEAHYSTANDWMTELTADFGKAHPNARALAMEWSVWSGAGMGEKLGVVEALMRDGITPVTLDAGLATLRQMLADPDAGPVLTIGGRVGGLPTLPMDTGQELPLTRFVDRVVVHYPNVELITEVELSAGSDPYLSDHLLDGDLLFPAVLGMEAMTQVATAALDNETVPLLSDVEFLRPIVVRPGSTTTLRLAALVRDTETVQVVIRAEDTGFSADHFRATLRLPQPALPDQGPSREAVQLSTVPVDPIADLYGSVLFQGKRFQRLLNYRRASARHAVAELGTTTPAAWFAPYLPQDMVLADPGTRDAVMHSIQCCVPSATLLPQGIEKLYLSAPADQESEYVIMDARERSQDGDSYTYDIDVLEPSGRVVERWQGLTLRAVRHKDASGPWVPAVLGSYVERSLEKVLGGHRSVVVEPDPAEGGADRRAQTELAAGRALGGPVTVQYRPDGKPEVSGASISASHSAGLSLVVTGTGPVGCDLEVVTARSDEDWAGLLGEGLTGVRDLLVSESGEGADVAGTRVWSALECLRKTGDSSRNLTVDRVEAGGWVVLSAGDAKIATWTTTVNGVEDPVVIAVLSAEVR